MFKQFRYLKEKKKNLFIVSDQERSPIMGFICITLTIEPRVMSYSTPRFYNEIRTISARTSSDSHIYTPTVNASSLPFFRNVITRDCFPFTTHCRYLPMLCKIQTIPLKSSMSCCMLYPYFAKINVCIPYPIVNYCHIYAGRCLPCYHQE